ncbi:MAG: hypothetical protein R2706_07560 [Acidimicrobiales bacterium]
MGERHRSSRVPLVDDFAEACLAVMERYDQHGHLNVGAGADVPISELATLIRDTVYPEATLRFDQSKPDGIPRKFLEATAIRELGWAPTTSLAQGVAQTYEWFVEHLPSGYAASTRGSCWLPAST